MCLVHPLVHGPRQIRSFHGIGRRAVDSSPRALEARTADAWALAESLLPGTALALLLVEHGRDRGNRTDGDGGSRAVLTEVER